MDKAHFMRTDAEKPPAAAAGARSAQLELRLGGSAQLPSRFGDFRVLVFSSKWDGKEHLAMVHGDVSGRQDVVTRLHSECLTGDVLGSLRCDCRDQLETSLRHIGSLERGVLLYLRQEGRGIGLTNKIRAYELQERGLDTVDANLALGFADDLRSYGNAAEMLRWLGVRGVRLMTNNPDKLRKLAAEGIAVQERIPLITAATAHNRRYLSTKARRSGHLFAVDRGETL